MMVVSGWTIGIAATFAGTMLLIGCLGWECGCTSYAKKRRLLRAHRVQMRVMTELIEEQGLEEELRTA